MRRSQEEIQASRIRTTIAQLWKDLPGLTGGDWPKVAVLLVAAVRPELLLDPISPDDPSLPYRLRQAGPLPMPNSAGMAERIVGLLRPYHPSAWQPDSQEAFDLMERIASMRSSRRLSEEEVQQLRATLDAPLPEEEVQLPALEALLKERADLDRVRRDGSIGQGFGGGVEPWRADAARIPGELLQEVREAVAALWDVLPGQVGADWPEVAVLLVAAVRPDLLLEPISPESPSMRRELVDHPETTPAPDPDDVVERVVDLLRAYGYSLWDFARAARNPLLRRRIDELGGLGREAAYGPPSRGVSPVPIRYVNVIVVDVGADQSIAVYGRPLYKASNYELLVNIGRYVDGNLLQQPEADWPDDLLPDQGVWLRAMLVVDGGRTPDIRPFFLPREGESFACDCTVGGEHMQECTRRPWLRFPLRTPRRLVDVEGELVIYYQATAVVAVRLGLSVRYGRAYATVIGRLTSTFNDLGKLAGHRVGRSVAVLVARGGQRHLICRESVRYRPRCR
jgi:hypothetical protein